MEGIDKRGRVEEDGPVRQADVALADGLEVVLGDAGLADGPGRQVGDVVAVVHDLSEEGGDAGLGPVTADDGQHVAEHVRLGDGAVDIGDYHLVGRLPPVDVAAAARGALVGGRHAELDLVHAGLQIEPFLNDTKK